MYGGGPFQLIVDDIDVAWVSCVALPPEMAGSSSTAPDVSMEQPAAVYSTTTLLKSLFLSKESAADIVGRDSTVRGTVGTPLPADQTPWWLELAENYGCTQETSQQERVLKLLQRPQHPVNTPRPCPSLLRGNLDRAAGQPF